MIFKRFSNKMCPIKVFAVRMFELHSGELSETLPS
jgi:hypothetical protein